MLSGHGEDWRAKHDIVTVIRLEATQFKAVTRVTMGPRWGSDSEFSSSHPSSHPASQT